VCAFLRLVGGSGARRGLLRGRILGELRIPWPTHPHYQHRAIIDLFTPKYTTDVIEFGVLPCLIMFLNSASEKLYDLQPHRLLLHLKGCISKTGFETPQRSTVFSTLYFCEQKGIYCTLKDIEDVFHIPTTTSSEIVICIRNSRVVTFWVVRTRNS
jgi:hypothetical protein